MLNLSQKLVELVRILEERAYIFPGDPVQATEALRHIDGGNEEKLIRRAQIIDRDQHLKYVLQQVETGSFWLWIVAATLLFTFGFSSTYLLMDNQGLNFFLVLAGILGMNTVMLLVWLATLFLRLKMCTLSAVRQLGSEVKTRSIRLFCGFTWTNGAIRKRVG